jgi:HK97 family phage prohead protease
MDELQTREMLVRVTDQDAREVSGIAVPYEVVSHGEMFARDAVTLDGNPKLFWQHAEPIGKIMAGRHTPDGFEITARLSETPRGNEAYTLLKDGVIDRFSVGFEMRDAEQKDGVRVVTDAYVREVSLVAFPWYGDAVVSEVRDVEGVESDSKISTSANKMEMKSMDEINPMLSELAEVRESVALFEREIAEIKREATPAVDTRSAAEFVKAVAKGDEAAVRAYTGATTAESVTTPIDRDLVAIVEKSNPLSTVFATGVTPATGLTIDFARLNSVTDGTAVQAAEGDDLGYYEIDIVADSVAVKTIGNHASMSRQTIDRSTVNFLDTTLRGQAVGLGNKLHAELVAAYKTVHAAQVTAGNTVTIEATSATYNDFLGGIIDAAGEFDTIGLPIEAILVDVVTFKEIAALQGSDGRPVMLVGGAGVNNVGSVNVPGLTGQIAGIPVIADSALDSDKSECAFVNGAALRQYTSAALRLSGVDDVALTNSFSLSTYSAVADELPAAILPIVRA